MVIFRHGLVGSEAVMGGRILEIRSPMVELVRFYYDVLVFVDVLLTRHRLLSDARRAIRSGDDFAKILALRRAYADRRRPIRSGQRFQFRSYHISISNQPVLGSFANLARMHVGGYSQIFRHLLIDSVFVRDRYGSVILVV